MTTSKCSSGARTAIGHLWRALAKHQRFMGAHVFPMRDGARRRCP